MEKVEHTKDRYSNTIRDAHLILGAIKRFDLEIISATSKQWKDYLNRMVNEDSLVYVSPVRGEDLQEDIVELRGFTLDGYVYAFYITPYGIKQFEEIGVEKSTFFNRIATKTKSFGIFKFPADMFQCHIRKSYYLESDETTDLDVYIINQNYLVEYSSC